MKLVQTKVYVSATKGLAELNHHNTRDEQNEIRSGVAREGHELSEEVESRINKEAEHADSSLKELVHAQGATQKPQLQSQGPVVCWEKFLPIKSLKVLLVENDDSTRQIVSALLKNCSYDVTAVENGLQAWSFLEDLTNHVDLVLTEVVMPCLSGIGLLIKIVNHKSTNNIPVIMMSTHNSIGVAFKCFSKGAVDFLVKPIRKNELRTLWQHVWRKCHIQSYGNGSESGSWTAKSIGVEESDNNARRNNEDDRNNGHNVMDVIKYGIGTQRSGNRRTVKFGGSPTMKPGGQLADTPDKIRPHFISSMPEALSNNGQAMTARSDFERWDDENVAMGKDLEIGVRKNPNRQLEDRSEKQTNKMGSGKGELHKIKLKNYDDKSGKGKLGLKGAIPNDKLKNQAAAADDATAKNIKSLVGGAMLEIPDGVSNTSETEDNHHGCEEMPFLELSLKQPRDDEDNRTRAHDRNVLRHSDLSAFSRYTLLSSVNQTPNGNTDSCSPVDKNSKTANAESMNKLLLSNSNGTSSKQHSNGSSSNNDMGSTTYNAFTNPETLENNPPSKTTMNYRQPSSTFLLVRNNHIPPSLCVPPGRGNVAVADALTNTVGRNQQAQVQHHHHHYYHHHHVHEQMSQEQKVPNHWNSSLKNVETMTTNGNRETANVLHAPIKDDTGYHSLNGSSHGSNGPSSNIGTNMESGSMSGVDQSRITQRKAALNRFCQKRKERCFDKKVRYQSRKRLAEQRPRVRGQFVPQAIRDNKYKAEGNS